MRKNKTNRTLLTLAALAALVLNSHAAVVVDERFADGNRNGNTPPASLQWYASHTTGILAATTGSMTLQSVGSDGNAARAVGAHFPSVNMAVGDVLLLTFNFRCDGTLGDSGVAFRAGLFDSQGLSNNLFTTDGGNVQNSGTTYRGYGVNLNPKYVASTGISTPTLEVVERDGTHRFMTSSTAYQRLGSLSGPHASAQGIQPDRSYAARLRLERTVDRILVRIEIWSDLMESLLTYATEDTSGLVTTFDTVGFSIFNHTTDGGFSDAQLWNIKVATGAAAASHGIVYHATNVFAAWPANEGAWSWGDDEMLVSFNTAQWVSNPGSTGHHYTGDQETKFARSTDGGATWSLESHAHVKPQKHISNGDIIDAIPEIDFSHPGLALKTRGMLLFYSTDRGDTWSDPYRIPALLDQHVRARTSYIPLDADNALWFLVSTETDDTRGRSYVMRAFNDNGALKFNIRSIIGDDPGAEAGALENSWSIMPSAVRIADDHYVVAVRKRQRYPDGGGTADDKWTDIYESRNGCRDWVFLSELETFSTNPATLVSLGGPKLVAIYGCRRNESTDLGLRAKVSLDGGSTWGSEIQLRNGALNWDIGYTRVLPRPDGGLTILYYYCTSTHQEQHIARTIWYP